DRGHRHRGGTERDRPHGRPRAPPRGRSGAGHRAAVPLQLPLPRARVRRHGLDRPPRRVGRGRAPAGAVRELHRPAHPRLPRGGAAAPAVTRRPEVTTAGGPSLRWACPTPVTLPGGEQEVWWICEDHTGGEQGPRTGADGAPHIERYIAAVPLDGSAANDPAAIRRVTPA